MLDLAADLPEVEFAPGDVIISEGGSSDSVYVLVSGALEVRRGDVVINTIGHPGALVGEVSHLLRTTTASTVVATETSRLRHAADGTELLSRPEVIRLVAVGLAERLNAVSTYLADLKLQYGDAPGLSMVPGVLDHLAHRQGPSARPGSARDPDPRY
jgi:CRP-like cAMP-binding protein